METMIVHVLTHYGRYHALCCPHMHIMRAACAGPAAAHPGLRWPSSLPDFPLGDGPGPCRRRGPPRAQADHQREATPRSEL
eukprot:scaffold51348_cov52-Prasinocladus_malaysianus.AAC.1